MEPRNVNFIVNNNLCISCGVCEVICPSNAISMLYSPIQGMIYPQINEEECIECGACLDVCYGYAVDRSLSISLYETSPRSVIGNYQTAYSGFACDEETRNVSTSGGIIPALLISLLEGKKINKAIVVTIEPGTLPHAKAIIAQKPPDIISATGSKYCPVSLADCIKKIGEHDEVAVVGLPCHIYGIRKLAERNFVLKKAIRFYFGIFCGGMPNYLATKYLLRDKGFLSHEILRFEYRGGDWPGHLIIHSRYCGKRNQISTPYPEYWLGTFHYFLPFRCTVCNDGFNEFSDISCGDLWISLQHREKKTNHSLIIARTQKGEEIIQNALKEKIIDVFSIGVADVVNAQKGIEDFKWKKLRARIQLAKFLRLPLPTFDFTRTYRTSISSILRAIDLYLGRFFASRFKLWYLFDVFIGIKRKIGEIITRREKVRTR